MKLAKDQIARQFSRAASTYDRAAELQNEMGDKMIDSIPSAASGSLVDLGCGTGRGLDSLASLKRFELTAIDIAPGMIEIAQSRVPTATFHCCDLESTPLDSESADIVYSNAAVQWCDVGLAIEEIRRICKPNGGIFISTFGPRTMNEVRSAWQLAGDQVDRIHDFESPEVLDARLKKFGFKNVSVTSEERVIRYQSVDALLQSIKQMGATNASTSRQTGLLGTGQYRAFREVFDARLQLDGCLKLTFECVFASANKR